MFVMILSENCELLVLFCVCSTIIARLQRMLYNVYPMSDGISFRVFVAMDVLVKKTLKAHAMVKSFISINLVIMSFQHCNKLWFDHLSSFHPYSIQVKTFHGENFVIDFKNMPLIFHTSQVLSFLFLVGKI